MDNNRRTVTLELGGHPYRMTSDADGTHLERLAALINERVEALGPKAQKSSNPAHILAVVALGLADELLAAEERGHDVIAAAQHASKQIVEALDAGLSDAR